MLANSPNFTENLNVGEIQVQKWKTNGLTDKYMY